MYLDRCIVDLFVDNQSNPVEEGLFEGLSRASCRFVVFIGLSMNH